jgi:hypothetical protein
MTDKYRLEELDHETREYLRLAREQDGRGLPGFYLGQTDVGPVAGIIAGFVIIVITVLITFPPTDQPAKEAMLQTAGFLLGGWLILAAFRVWAAGKSGRYAGHFVYADPNFLYDANGSTLQVTELADLREAKAVPNFNDGKYKNTAINLKLKGERRTVTVDDEDCGRRLAIFLNAVAYIRDGGEDGKDETLRKLSPEAMGAVAKIVAMTGEFPADPTRAEEGNAIRVPEPRREGRPSSGLLGMGLIALIGTGMFLGFLAMDYPVRDETVFAQIEALPPNEQPPALRLYLSNDKFTAHRDEAKWLLDERYQAGVAANINGTNPEMKRGLAEVVLALKDKPTGALSLRTVEEVSPNGLQGGANSRQKSVGEKLADKWGITIGDEFVVFAMLDDPQLPANIDLRWKFTDAGAISYTITFRKSPDEEPIVTATGTVAAVPDPGRAVETMCERTVNVMCDQVLSGSVGTTKVRPVLPPEDF